MKNILLLYMALFCYSIFSNDSIIEGNTNKKIEVSRGSLIFKNTDLGSLKNVVDLYSMDELLSVDHFAINNCDIYDVHGLDVISNMSMLVLINNKSITDISGFDTLKFNKLKWIILKNNSILRIPKIRSDKLDRVDLDGNDIKIIECLDNYSNIKEIYLDDNNIRVLENLSPLKNVRVLSLGDNPISKIENLDSLITIENLNLSNALIVRIEGLKHLKNLKKLTLDGNRIEDIENLETLKKLQTLSLNNNKITEIKSLQELVNLTHLDLENNYISQLPAPEYIDHIRYIDLSHNHIKTLPDFGKYKSYISLKNNRIESLEGLANMSKEHIDYYFNAYFQPSELSGNPIKEIPITDYDYFISMIDSNGFRNGNWLLDNIANGTIKVVD